MTDKKQLVDISRVLDEIKEIKNLERELREWDYSPDDLQNLLGPFEPILTAQECGEFLEKYSGFVKDYVSELRDNKLQSLYDANKASLENTPEGKYLQELVKRTGKKKIYKEMACEMKVDNSKLLDRIGYWIENF